MLSWLLLQIKTLKNSPKDNYRFEYRGGAIEDTNKSNNVGVGILNCKNMQEHICEILEGGEKAFL